MRASGAEGGESPREACSLAQQTRVIDKNTSAHNTREHLEEQVIRMK